MKNYHVEGIFPSPILFSKLERNFTEDEITFCKNIETNVDQNMGNNYTSTDKKILKNRVLGPLKNDLMEVVQYYMNNIVCGDDRVEPYITQSWLNYTRKNQSHHQHTHANSFISGIIYISANKEYDKIFFHKEDDKLLKVDQTTHNAFNSESWFCSVETGKIILFPSSLSHSVETKTDDGYRCSLSFNVYLKGVVGSYKNATELLL